MQMTWKHQRKSPSTKLASKFTARKWDHLHWCNSQLLIKLENYQKWGTRRGKSSRETRVHLLRLGKVIKIRLSISIRMAHLTLGWLMLKTRFSVKIPSMARGTTTVLLWTLQWELRSPTYQTSSIFWRAARSLMRFSTRGASTWKHRGRVLRRHRNSRKPNLTLQYLKIYVHKEV